MRLAVHFFDRRSVEVDFGVDNKERIVSVDDIIINTDTIKVLFEERFEKHVLFLQGCFLLFNGKLVKENLIKALIKVVHQLKLIVPAFFHSFNLFNVDIRHLLHGDFV